ncbi:MAG TPA: mannitol dehydrogenase family protein [Streptosporangiaceae bacterium]|nr:mannitol dehydrogenase family protein [Streptosporangiaceae bacterium]
MTGEALPLLRLGTLDRVPGRSRPRADPRALGLGIVHLGPGVFHRAHQAVFTEDTVAATGDTRWGITAVSQRSAAVVAGLRRQDGLYTVLERAEDVTSARVVGVIRAVASAAWDPAAIVAAVADPATTVVTMTVTEKGYRRDPATGGLRLTDPGIEADLAGRPPLTVVGQLARGLQRRMQRDSGPLTMVCCDNLPGNGRVLADLVGQFLAALPAGEGSPVADWAGRQAAFPVTMVDRIAPAPTGDDLATVARLIGVADESAVVTEPFRQWVIEDRFAGPRPAWEAAGATLTRDVGPFEQAKLRLLNGSHSMLAYLGGLAGYQTVHEALRRPAFAAAVQRLMTDDVTPTLQVPDGMDVASYRSSVLTRFSNAALPYTTAKVAMDGSQKLGPRLLGTVRDRLATGAEPRWAALAVAGWMRQTWRQTSDTGRPLPLDDPLAERIRTVAGAAATPVQAVDALLGICDIFEPELAESPLRGLLVDWMTAMDEHGTEEATAVVASQ